MPLSEIEFKMQIREAINLKLDEWFQDVPFVPDLVGPEQIPREIINILEWMLEDANKNRKERQNP